MSSYFKKSLLTVLVSILSISLFSQTYQLNPDSAYKGDTLTVTVFGQSTHFDQSGTTMELFRFVPGSNLLIPANNIVITNDTVMNVDFVISTSHPTGDYDVVISSPLDGSDTLEDGFRLLDKEIELVSPLTAEPGDSLTVSITGIGTNFSVGNNTVYLRPALQATSTWDIHAYNVIVNSDVSISAEFEIPNTANVGAYNIKLSNPVDGTLGDSGFNILGPEITSISPDEGFIGDSLTVSISGELTHFDTTTTVNFIFFQGTGTGTNLSLSNINVQDPTSLSGQLYIPDNADAGNYIVEVNSVQDPLLSDNFTVRRSALDSVSPDYANLGDTLTVTLFGINTSFEDTSTHIEFAYPGTNLIIFPESVNAVSNEVIEANYIFPDSIPSGYYTIRVNNNTDGYLSLPYTTFYINPNLGGNDTVSGNLSTDSVERRETSIPVYYQKLILRDNSNNLLMARTDTTGYFEFTNLINGTYTMTASNTTNLDTLVFDINGVNNYVQLDILIKEDGVSYQSTGIVDLKDSQYNMYSYPNPFRDKVVLKIENDNVSTSLNLDVFNVAGQLVYSEKILNLQAGTFLKEISTEKLGKGTYFVKLSDDNTSSVLKMIKLD